MADDPMTWSEVDPRMFDDDWSRRLSTVSDVAEDTDGGELDWARYWRVTAAVIVTVYLFGILLLVLR
jgi:hypothetical protein